jgi:hypothetical protein
MVVTRISYELARGLRGPLEAPAFSLGQTAPDPEPLIGRERVLQTFSPDRAAGADPFRR